MTQVARDSVKPLLQQSDDDDDSEDFSNHIGNERNLEEFDIRMILAGRQYSCRRLRRVTRFFIIFATVVVILLLIYIPIFNNISRLVTIPGWDHNTSRNVSQYVLPDKDTTIIQPRGVCLNNFFLLIVVCSSVDNFEERQIVRETWGNITEFNYPLFKAMHSHVSGQYLEIQELALRLHDGYLNLNKKTNLKNQSYTHNFPIRIIFLIGKHSPEATSYETLAKLKLESEQYDDLLQEDFYDTYNNLTIKSVMMLKWVARNCQNRAKFLMKCDDDVFVNIPNLIHFLLRGTIPVYNSTVELYDAVSIKVNSPKNRLMKTEDFLTGHVFCMVKPVSDTSSKWYAPYYMFEGDMYPNYLSGSSYLMSFDVITKLYNESLKTPLLHLEDVYLTGICANNLQIRRRHNPLFLFNHLKDECSFKGIITQHYLKGDVMRDIYTFVTNTTIRCPRPDRTFNVRRLRKRVLRCV